MTTRIDASGNAVDSQDTEAPGRIEAARNATGDAYSTARDKVGSALEGARERLGDVYGDARDRSADLARKTGDSIQEHPVAALVGGLALGALVAAVLPRTEREVAALGAIGGRLNDAARSAADAAKQAGRDKLDELGLTPDRAQDAVSKLFADVAKAATHAGTAAATAVRTGKDAG
ncbi:DUF883 family protein [Sphingomonas quercus]|uniref:DUF883 family protein n=1 Tax=Sphingomonas quercus TaxID=2842451 RepID=A0ABS6BGI9_9SPHN|nr:DUF883 family protein [Sphingomonas quercus]MBU3076389.1 DUF883 family protein [Sphingomonas quercus]